MCPGGIREQIDEQFWIANPDRKCKWCPEFEEWCYFLLGPFRVRMRVFMIFGWKSICRAFCDRQASSGVDDYLTVWCICELKIWILILISDFMRLRALIGGFSALIAVDSERLSRWIQSVYRGGFRALIAVDSECLSQWIQSVLTPRGKNFEFLISLSATAVLECKMTLTTRTVEIFTNSKQEPVMRHR